MITLIKGEMMEAKQKGASRSCPNCGEVFSDIERYGNHVRGCKKK